MAVTKRVRPQDIVGLRGYARVATLERTTAGSWRAVVGQLHRGKFASHRSWEASACPWRDTRDEAVMDALAWARTGHQAKA